MSARSPVLAKSMRLVFVVALGAGAIVGAAEPPIDPEPPVGWSDYCESGEYPVELELPLRRPALEKHPVMLPHSRATPPASARPSIDQKRYVHSLWEERLAYYQLREAGKVTPSPPLLIVGAGRHQVDKARHNCETKIDLDKCPGLVTPILGRLYLVSRSPKGSVLLRRIVDDVANQHRPDEASLTVSTVEYVPGLFWEHKESPRVEWLYYWLKDLTFEGESASFELKPMRSNLPLEDRPSLHLKVKAGDLITASGRSYRVLNVVPPQRVEDLKLAGWVEIANDPEPPPAADDPARPEQ